VKQRLAVAVAAAVLVTAAAAVPLGTAAPAVGGSQSTQAQVAKLQAQLTVAPYDPAALDALGLAYQQRARETGDPTYYTKSAGVLRRALSVHPHDLLATSGLGSLALSQHRFGEALVLGRKALRISPTTARNYGVVGDAYLELGRYPQAFRAFDTMASLRPGLDSYARIGHARELIGDWTGAVQSMEMALDASLGEPEATAWTYVQLAKLYWNRGRYAPAAAAARASLRAFPGYPYAFDILAQVEAARGHTARAIALESRATDAIPLPQFVTFLGDLYRSTGRLEQARQQYALIGVIERLLHANGVRTDLETALFDADHGRASVALARKAERARPSIDGDDVLAWTLERHGQCREALPWSQRALHLGTRDALKFFHFAMIERCLGHRATARTWFARALALNPHFSVLWAPTARRYA
jgi:tetratricopeptide (TPR) repeat protein